MCRCLAVVGLLALMAQGCTKKPESYPLSSQSYPLSSLSVDYQTWNCQQLANEADLLKDATSDYESYVGPGAASEPETRNVACGGFRAATSSEGPARPSSLHSGTLG